MLFQKRWNRFHWLQNNRNKARRGFLNRIHPEEEFRLLLERERVRTERTGVKFSLVIFDIGNLKDPSMSVEGFINALPHRVRSTDEVGWFSEQEMGVLLINTSIDGAWKFAGNVIQKVPNRAIIRSFQVCTYPMPRQKDPREDSKKFQLIGHSRQLDRSILQGKLISPALSPDRQEDSIRSELSTPSHSPLGTIDSMEKILARRSPRWKRMIDIVGSIIGLLIFSPLMLGVAVAIKLTSPGPIFFKQERVGFLGETFTLLKFRSMDHNNSPEIHKQYIECFIKDRLPMRPGREQDEIYKLENDPRVTPVGRFLRKMSLDELPQFINVLKGEMSLVGPRPPILYEYQHYDIWHKRRAWEVKPGITGLWQVKGRSQTTFDQMTRLDMKYLKECSLWLDLKILIQTPWAVFAGKGAY